MKVSVIIPAYNIEKHIGHCLKSIINQTLKEIEIIVVNDGSTDNTGNIINSYRNVDERIRVITTNNRGVSAARNEGISKAKGEFIFQIDGDDCLESDALEELYAVAKERKADIVIANAYNNDQGILTPIIDGEGLTNDLIKDFLLGKIKPSVWTKLYKRDLFVDYNIKYLKGIRIGEDLLINTYLIFYAKRVVKLDKHVLHYIKRDDSITNSYKEEIKDILIVFNEIQKFLKAKQLYTKYKSEYMYLKYFHTYYLRVVNSNKFGSIHKQIYEDYKQEKKAYRNNKYITELNKGGNLTSKVSRFLYNRNYYLGLLFRKTILFFRRTKMGNTIIIKLRKGKINKK